MDRIEKVNYISPFVTIQISTLETVYRDFSGILFFLWEIKKEWKNSGLTQK